MGILTSTSLSPEKRETIPVEETVSKKDEQLLNIVQPINEIKEQSIEAKHDNDDDDALSSFSPEVVEVINEEEEKVA